MEYWKERETGFAKTKERLAINRRIVAATMRIEKTSKKSPMTFGPFAKS